MENDLALSSLAILSCWLFFTTHKKKNLFLPLSITLTYTYNGAFDKVNHQRYKPFQNWTSLEVLSVGLSPTVFHGKKHHGEGCLNHPSARNPYSFTCSFPSNNPVVLSWAHLPAFLTINLELDESTPHPVSLECNMTVQVFSTTIKLSHVKPNP